MDEALGIMFFEPMKIRACTTDDISTLSLIGAATVLESFAGLLPGPALLAHCHKNHTPTVYADFLSQATTFAWLAEVDPAVGAGPAPIGYAMLTAPDFPADLVHPGDLELKRIYAFSRFHGTGVGPALLEAAVEQARKLAAKRLLLGVHRENARALSFYARNGFVEIGQRAFHLGPEIFDDPVLALTL
jgi:ribosomal protein S18 acetylase RimI-like enzyme